MNLTDLERFYLDKAAGRDLERNDIGAQGGMNAIRGLLAKGLLGYVPGKRSYRITDDGRHELPRTKSHQSATGPMLDIERAHRVAAEHGFRIALDEQGNLRVVGWPGEDT